MTMRALLCGIGLIAAMQATGSVAQTVAAPPVIGEPRVIDASPEMPGAIPEIIRDSDGDENLSRSKAIADPGAVLKPPPVNFRILRAIGMNGHPPGDAATAPE